MRSLLVTAASLALLVMVAGCTAVQQRAPSDPILQVEPSKAVDTVAATSTTEVVPENLVHGLLDAAHSRGYTVWWTASDNPSEALYGGTSGRSGVLPNGDRYVFLSSNGFVHRGNQAWYIYTLQDGTIGSDKPEEKGLHQRPGIQAWEGIKPDALGILDAMSQNASGFVRSSMGAGHERWTSTDSFLTLKLFRSEHAVLEFWVDVETIDGAPLPARFHVSWSDAGKTISFDGTYTWTDPEFPQFKLTGSPAAASPPPGKLLADTDLDGDGQAEQLYVSDAGSVQILRKPDTKLFAYQLTQGAQGAKASVYPITGRPPLIGVAWPGCNESWPDNLFISWSPEKRQFVTDRTPATAAHCGRFQHLGNGRFDVTYSMNGKAYHWTKAWDMDHFVVQDASP